MASVDEILKRYNIVSDYINNQTDHEWDRLVANVQRNEDYNGWANRETWAVSLHLNNSQWLQELAIAYARLDEWGDALADRVGEMFQDVIDGEGDYANQDVRLMIGDVGSLWRVDWKSVRDGLLED